MKYLHTPEEVCSLPQDEVRARFGAKIAGLLSVPKPWRPNALFIARDLYERWLRDKAKFVNWCEEHLKAEIFQAQSLLGSDVILRSSASDETIRERGQFLSSRVDLNGGVRNLAVAAEEIFLGYEGHGGVMCLALQQFVTAEASGFLSNELRLVDKPYRWIAERQTHGNDDGSSQHRLSAKQAKPFPDGEALICMSDGELLARLRSVALRFWKASSQRTLLEWCWDGNRLWILQRDLCLPRAGGRIPSSFVEANVVPPTLSEGKTFSRFIVGSESPWGKLRNVSDFALPGRPPPHRLFFASAYKVQQAILKNRDELVSEIASLTGGRCVLRTDALKSEFNRGRTNTVAPGAALEWMEREIAQWASTDYPLQDVAFILHAYIPAPAAAWSYFTRGAKHVRVDGLWGLADGMQYYPCDTFICDPVSGEELSVTQRFKNLALLEQSDGSWRTEEIDERYARHRALSKAATRDIAIRTRQIAESLQRDVQIMWFVGVPKALALEENLPWYKVTPEQPIAERRSKLLRTIVVRNLSDLAKLETAPKVPSKVLLEPSGEDLRSNSFIAEVCERCKKFDFVVELRGSTLSHAYHQLLCAGVQVFTSEPGKKLAEIRQRKAFDKLVRDEIPEFIARKGEQVRADELDPADLRSALIGKLFEEAGEFLAASSSSAMAEELSDLLEVIRGLSASAQVQFSDVTKRADDKAARRGGFAKGIILRSTEVSRREHDDPQLFESKTARRKIRLHSLGHDKGVANVREIALASLLVGGPQDLTLRLGDKFRVSLRLSVEAESLIVEIRSFDQSEVDQPRFTGF